MTYPEIPDLPPAPLRSQPEDQYAATASTFVGAMTLWTQAVNTAGAWIQTTLATILGYRNESASAKAGAESARDTAQGHASSAANSASNALGYASDAAAFADIAAANANFAGQWSSLTGPLNIPATVFHNGVYWVLLNDLADVTLSEPGVTTDWNTPALDEVSWTLVSASATLAAGGHYKVDFTAGPLTLTLDGSASTNSVIRLVRVGGSPEGSLIARNGSTIGGLAENLNIDAAINGLTFIKQNSDWRILSE